MARRWLGTGVRYWAVSVDVIISAVETFYVAVVSWSSVSGLTLVMIGMLMLVFCVYEVLYAEYFEFDVECEFVYCLVL